MEVSPSSSRTDRNLIEKNRRSHMKSLYSMLNSLVPQQSSTNLVVGAKEVTSLPDKLHEATNYIKKLQIKVEKMKEKKERLLGIEVPNPSTSTVALRSPQIKINQTGAALQVILITGLGHQFMFNRVIQLLHDEGTEIIHASFSVVDDKVFHTIHCEAEAASHVSETLRKFVQDAAHEF